MINPFTFGTSKGFELKNDFLCVKLISYGARIIQLNYENKDLVLGFDSLQDYKQSTIYSGATIGRFANRIQNGSFVLNGKTYQLPKNENDCTTLHGGTTGFDRFEWDHEIKNEFSIRFFRTSPDKEMGFPGNLQIGVTYSLDKSTLKIEYDAKTDRDTPLSLTNHAYFNLDGYDGEDCRKMFLELQAPYYLPINDKLIPTGEIASVTGTIFDFQKEKEIENDFDHCFVFALDRKMRTVGTLFSKSSGIAMEIETDLPSIQFYTTSKCSEKSGKGNIPLHAHQAVALETQFFPDSPNHPNFPSTILQAGESFQSTTKYRFLKR